MALTGADYAPLVHAGPALVAASVRGGRACHRDHRLVPDGFREAVESGVARAAKTVRNITGLGSRASASRSRRGQISEYRVEMKLIFLLED